MGAEPLSIGVTYASGGVGPYLWHEFDRGMVAADVAAIAARRIPLVRVLLPWDVFLPSSRRPDRRRLGDIEAFLNAAERHRVRVVLVVGPQSLGDCVMLPAWAVDPTGSRRGIRVVTDGRVRSGGPADIWTEPIVADVHHAWMEMLLRTFGGHPAIAAWDLGHDPARAFPPRRSADMCGWVQRSAALIRSCGERSWLTLSASDALRRRGVRMDAISAPVDLVLVDLDPSRIGLGVSGRPHLAGALFVVALAQRLIGDQASLGVSLAVSSDTDPPGVSEAEILPAPVAARATEQFLVEAPLRGVAAVVASAWQDLGPRLGDVPPFDRRPALMRRGLLSASGESKPLCKVWEARARAETPVGRPRPLLGSLDLSRYYAELPDSARDLFAAWRDGNSDDPAILS